jgi:hypothetical protein
MGQFRRLWTVLGRHPLGLVALGYLILQLPPWPALALRTDDLTAIDLITCCPVRSPFTRSAPTRLAATS